MGGVEQSLPAGKQVNLIKNSCQRTEQVQPFTEPLGFCMAGGKNMFSLTV